LPRVRSMKSLTTERLYWVLVAGALTSWSLHFYRQFERPAIGWFEAAFGGWSVLPLSVMISASVVIMRIRAKTIASDPMGFYEKGAGRYVLVAMTLTASLGLILLSLRPHS
jgi:hypothetical protein